MRGIYDIYIENTYQYGIIPACAGHINLQQNFTDGFVSGVDPAGMSKRVEEQFGVAKYAARRLVLTEGAYFAAEGSREGYKQLGVEKYQILATLDDRTSDICQEEDGKIYAVKDYDPSNTAPPFHPYCRSTTAPYIEDSPLAGNEERAARDEGGKTIEIPAMSYKDWKNTFVGQELKEESLRTNKDKDFSVDWRIIKSKEYTERLSSISDNQKANNLAAQRCRNALVNRDGQKTEELYAISLTTGKDISSILDQYNDFRVQRTEKFMLDVERAEKKGEKVLYIHNHPRGLPPSITDINTLLLNKNAVGISAGHDGNLYYYSKPNKKITKRDLAVAEMHFLEYNYLIRQEMALNLLAERFEFVLRKL